MIARCLETVRRSVIFPTASAVISLFCWHLRYVCKMNMVRLGQMQFRIVSDVAFEAHS